MKQINTKNMLGLLLIICAIFSFYFGKVITFTLLQAVGIVSVLFLSILVLTFVSRKTTEQELIEEQDERNQYLALKRAAKNFEVVKYTLFLTMVCSLIGFGLTKEYAFIFVSLGAAIPYGILKVSYIVNLLRYN